MKGIKIQANNSRELTIKVLMYLSKCEEQGINPTSISFYDDSNYLYSVKIGTREVNYEPTAH